MSIKILNIFKGKNICLFSNDFRSRLTNLRKSSSRYGGKLDPLPNKYGGRTNITVLPGEGVGPEIMASALQVLEAAGAPLSFEILTISSEKNSEEDFENIITSIRRNKVALKANMETKSTDPLETSRNVLLRKLLDLYVYVLQCKTYPGLRNIFGEMNVTVIRQNTEGEYLMLEHEPTPKSAESLKIITKFNSERLAEYAFNYAMEHQRKLITVIHNADVHPLTEGLFLDAALKISRKYPAIKMNVQEVGVAVVNLERRPQLFDIILTTNLNGSMVSNILNGMVGGPGLSAGVNYNEEEVAVFEPGARNKGSSIAGKGIANPVAMIRAATNLLEHLDYANSAEIIRNSVYTTLVYDKVRTQDLGGNATTAEITDSVIYHIKQYLKPKIETKLTLHHRWKNYCDAPEIPPKKED